MSCAVPLLCSLINGVWLLQALQHFFNLRSCIKLDWFAGLVTILRATKAAQTTKLAVVKFMVAYQLLLSLTDNISYYLDGSRLNFRQVRCSTLSSFARLFRFHCHACIQHSCQERVISSQQECLEQVQQQHQNTQRARTLSHDKLHSLKTACMVRFVQSV